MKKLTWQQKVPFLKNTYILRSVFLAYLAVVLIVSIIVSSVFIIDGDASKLKELIIPFSGVFLLIFVLFFLSTWIVVGNKYAVKYTIGGDGIKIEGTRDKAKNIRRMAIMAGIITANPGLTGSGMLVRDDVIQIPWKDIDDLIWDHESFRLIVKCSFWKQVALHFPENKKAELKQLTESYMSSD